jgi:hypothetical protein
VSVVSSQWGDEHWFGRCSPEDFYIEESLGLPAPKIFIFDTSLMEVQAASDTGNPTDH